MKVSVWDYIEYIRKKRKQAEKKPQTNPKEKILIFILFFKTCRNTNLKVIKQPRPVHWNDYPINC